MKRIIGWIMVIMLCISIFILAVKKGDSGGISLKRDDLDIKLKIKGLKEAIDFTRDDKENYYIAFKNRIIIIENGGKSYTLCKNKGYNISNIEFYDGKLIFSSNSEILNYNIKNGEIKTLLKDLPNKGDYKDIMIKVYGDYAFLTIGSATNSGVVGEDNLWAKDGSNICDVSPYALKVKGINFNNGISGSFKPINRPNIENEIIEGELIGNSSIVILNLKTGATETFAWGIRNVTGIDVTSEGKVYAVVGGMENRGYRPVANDSDYIYEIKKSQWYGFPDFSGGDPLTSPRFSLNKDNKEKSTDLVLASHPTESPSAPMYVHNDVNTLKCLCADKNSILGNQDDMYVYDSNGRKINLLTKNSTMQIVGDVSSKGNITSIKSFEKEIIVLDSGDGKVYSLNKKSGSLLKVNKNKVYNGGIIIVVTAIISIIVLFMKDFKVGQRKQ